MAIEDFIMALRTGTNLLTATVTNSSHPLPA